MPYLFRMENVAVLQDHLQATAPLVLFCILIIMIAESRDVSWEKMITISHSS